MFDIIFLSGRYEIIDGITFLNYTTTLQSCLLLNKILGLQGLEKSNDYLKALNEEASNL